MFDTSFKVTTVWGIPIKVHISLVVLLVILALSMARAVGVRGVLFLMFLEACVFTSIALHELGHSYVALRKGCRVREITLLFIGGAAQMERIPLKPADEIQLAAAGPAVSVFLGMVLWRAGAILPLTAVPWPLPFGEISCNIVQYAGVINFWLAGFNLIPCFPMDGGRILRAWLARRRGRVAATFAAVKLGKAIALLFGAYGFVSMIRGEGGLILMALAFFIHRAAMAEYRLVLLQEAARRQGGLGWIPFASPVPEPGEPIDRVTIGPPPYGRGRGDEAEVRRVEGDGPDVSPGA